jgi:hypothetical protein
MEVLDLNEYFEVKSYESSDDIEEKQEVAAFLFLMVLFDLLYCVHF